jgi:uncharacterized protein (TIGR03067 family)
MFLNRLKILAAIVAVVLGAGATLFAFHPTSREPVKAPDRPKAADRDRPRVDKDLIQGVWDVTAVETGGKDQGAPEKKIVWEFKGNRVLIAESGLETGGIVTLDPGKNPRTMDILVTPAIILERDEILRCVYQLDGDTLKVCQAVEADRPAALATRAGEQNLLFTLKRRAAAKGPTEALRQRYGDKMVAILQGATRVEVFRLNPNDHVAPGKDDGKVKRFGGYAIIATAPELGEKSTRKVTALIFDRDNFALYRVNADDCDPEVGLRFWKGKESADVILSYQWNQLRVIAPDPKAQRIEFPMADFDPGRKAFVKLARELFPKDKEIQGLNENETFPGDLKEPKTPLPDRYGK